jgi:uncharacterized membrane protein YphA (DoxX/SURF4 family)
MRNYAKKYEVLLWTLQSLLAALFLFAGAMKFITPSEVLAQQSSLPVAFLRFIGTAEVLGALGLILPGIFRIRRGLTPLAAAGLVIIMLGATAIMFSAGIDAALVPFAVGVCCAFVAHRRAPVRVRPSVRGAAA